MNRSYELELRTEVMNMKRRHSFCSFFVSSLAFFVYPCTSSIKMMIIMMMIHLGTETPYAAS